MATSETFLDNILHFLSVLDDFPIYAKMREDGIIETDMGCFRTAYSRESRTVALFYARHADDLASVPGADGRLEIAHKERVKLISMEALRHDSNNRWHPHAGSDVEPPLNLDLSLLIDQIPTIIHRLSRAALREGVLHRLKRGIRVSAFIAYQVMNPELDEEKNRIQILTKLDRNYCVPELAAEIDPEQKEKGWIKKLFRYCGMELTRLNTSRRFALCVKDADGKDYKCFPADDITRAVNADFIARLKAIANGHDPVYLRENYFTPLLRAEAALVQRLKKINPVGDDFSWEETARASIKLAYHILTEEKLGLLKDVIVDTALEKVGLGERFKYVPREWQKLPRRTPRHFMRVASDLHNILHPVNVDEFRDLEWVQYDGKRFTAHCVRTPSAFIKSHPDRDFRNWVVSLFRSPHAATFAYRDAEGAIVNPVTNLDDTRVIQINHANGIVMHYDTHGHRLYAYYHKPEFAYDGMPLPDNAADYLKANRVWVVDFERSPGEDMWPIPFGNFRKILQKRGKPEIKLLSAQKPEKGGLIPPSEPVKLSHTTVMDSYRTPVM